MGADRALVDAAFKVASTKASGDVIDMKPLYSTSGSLSNNLFKVFDTAMQGFKAKKELNRAGVRKQLEGFQADAGKLVAGMYAQDEPLHDAFIDAFRSKITQLQDDFEDVNTYGKGDNEENRYARAKIMGELKRVQNEANNFRIGTEAFFKSLVDVDPDTLSGRNIAAHRQALDFTNYDDLIKAGKIKVGYGKNGIEIYSKDYNTKTSGGFGALTPGADGSFARTIESTGEQVTVTLDSLQYNFKPTDKIHHTEIFADINNAVTNAKVEALKPNAQNNYNEDEYNEIFTRHVNTKTKFRNAVSSKIEGIHEIKSSFKVSLENNLNIPIAVLSNMFLDANDDGVNDMPTILKELNLAGGNDIDAEDIAKGQGNAAFEQNLDALIDALTNVDNPAFDIELSSGMLGKYFGEITKNRYDQVFNKTAVETNTKGSNTFEFNVLQGYNMIVPGSDGKRRKEYVSGQLIVNAQDFINDMVEGSVLEGYDGNIYKVKDGKFLQGDNIVTQSRISKNLGIWSYGYKPKDTYEIEVKEDPIYEPSTYKKGNYVVGKKRYSTIGEALSMWSRNFKKKNPNATKQEIADAVAAERELMRRAQ